MGELRYIVLKLFGWLSWECPICEKDTLVRKAEADHIHHCYHCGFIMIPLTYQGGDER